MAESIGFVGLGNMGLPMGANLLAAGFSLRLYNRTAQKARPLAEKGAIVVNSPAEASTPGGTVITMRGGDEVGGQHNDVAGDVGGEQSPQRQKSDNINGARRRAKQSG